MLVVGSSLTVWSGYRFVRRAAEHKLPIAIVNIGPTRADDLATLKVEEKCGEALTLAAQRLNVMITTSGSIPKRNGSTQ